MKKDTLIYYYSALQGLYWMSYGCIFSFTAVYLLDYGFSDGSIGTFIAISCLLSVLLQPFLAGAADKGVHFTLKKIFILLCCVQLLPLILLSVWKPPMIGVALLYSFLILIHLSMQPLLSALGIQLIQNDIPVNFGVARGIGSLSFSVLTFFLGSLTVIFTTKCLPMIASCLTLLILFLIHRFPEMGSRQNQEIIPGGTISVLKRNPRFAFLVLGIAFIFASHNATNNYMIHILKHIGKGNAALGQLMSYIAFLEVPAMLLCTRLMRKWDCGKLLRFTAIFFVVKSIGIPLAYNLPLLYLVVSVQAISFAPFTAAIVYYVSGALTKHDQVKGQALITIAITIGNVLGSLAGGYILQFFNVSILMWVFAVVSFIGMVFFLFGVQVAPQHDVQYAA